MSDLLDYVAWRGDITFEASPFNKIDALVLSQITYLDFNGYLASDFKVQKSLGELVSSLSDDDCSIMARNLGPFINEKTIDLLLAVGKSERFKKVTACGFWDILDEVKPEQFAAITFSYKKKNFVSFRGTDDTLIGWKEDCILAYTAGIPSHLEAVKYLKAAMSKLRGDFILAGHSKGGSLAVYSGMTVEAGLKKRISNIYNFDGPGFKEEVFNSSEYKSISDKIHSVFPECSFVGVIFNSTEDFEIVESSEKAVMQHDPMSWNVYGLDFVHKDEFRMESQVFRNTFNEWTSELTTDQIIDFSNALFEIVGSTGAKTTSDLEENKIQKSAKIVHELAKLERERRNGLLKMVRMFMKIGSGYFPVINIFKNPLLSKETESDK